LRVLDVIVMQYLKRTILDFLIVAKEFIVIKAGCFTGGMYEAARIAVDGEIRPGRLRARI